ncbi:MAG: DUF308 domain-containing protein [Bacteroidaceae bacterium]|nr:DUF308 domain-containing protein [Bacteroidaceae bacterium]
MNSSVLRGITSLLIGCILVFWSQRAITYLVMAIGCLFLIPALLSLFSYLIARSKGKEVRFGWTQMVNVGSILFGGCLLLNPLFFEKTLMYALGAILVYAGLSEIISFTGFRQWTRVPGAFYVVPVLIILLGIFILVNPVESANLPFILLGIGGLVYGFSELVSAVKFRRKNSNVEEVTVVEELPADDTSSSHQ